MSRKYHHEPYFSQVPARSAAADNQVFLPIGGGSAFPWAGCHIAHVTTAPSRKVRNDRRKKKRPSSRFPMERTLTAIANRFRTAGDGKSFADGGWFASSGDLLKLQHHDYNLAVKSCRSLLAANPAWKNKTMDSSHFLPWTRFTLARLENVSCLVIAILIVASFAGGCNQSGSSDPTATGGKGGDASALSESMTAIEPRTETSQEGSDDQDMEVALDSSEGAVQETTEAETTAAASTDAASTDAATTEAATTDTATTDTPAAEPATEKPDELPAAPVPPAPPVAPVASAEKEPVTLGDPSLTAGIPGEGPVTLSQVTEWLADPKNHVMLDVQLPMGLAAASSLITGLDQNPMTRAKIELGRQLYFDKRLSSDGSISCASCHDPAEGFARHTQFGEGVGGQKGNRNSPSSYNRIVSGPQFWDGRATSLEEQAKGPIANPIEMSNTHEHCVSDIQANPVYRAQFAQVFPGEPINIDTVAKAIATFERALVTSPAPYDYLERARAIESQYDEEELASLEADDPELFAEYQGAKKEVAKMSESAIRGRDLFFSEKSNCTACHAGANFTDEKYHNLGVGMDAPEPDLGRFTQTQVDADRGAFKTPGLRNVIHSGPYMHDGSQKTLEEVVEWYAKGGHPNPYLSDKMKKLELTEQDKKDLVAFMTEGLTSEFAPVQVARLPE
jgi:cytochrome c peroxidase